jgi:hypothetical protein
MDHGSSATYTRPKWLKPGEVWGGDNSDNPEIGSTLGLRVKRWYRSWNQRQETRGHVVGSKITLRKLVLVLVATGTAYLFLYLAISYAGMSTKVSRVMSACQSSCRTDIVQKFGFTTSSPTSCPVYSRNKTFTGPRPAFDPPELSDYRNPDSVDTFNDYLYRNNTNCQISSLDLHAPFAPLCTTRADILEAISGGGRIGFGAPFMPRGCDMRWFTTEEVCEIFSRFEKVIVVGDSMMRHVVGALNVLLREDLGYGAVTNWNFSPKEK